MDFGKKRLVTTVVSIIFYFLFYIKNKIYNRYINVKNCKHFFIQNLVELKTIYTINLNIDISIIYIIKYILNI